MTVGYWIGLGGRGADSINGKINQLINLFCSADGEGRLVVARRPADRKQKINQLIKPKVYILHSNIVSFKGIRRTNEEYKAN